jgi:hypothetical protein
LHLLSTKELRYWSPPCQTMDHGKNNRRYLPGCWSVCSVEFESNPHNRITVCTFSILCQYGRCLMYLQWIIRCNEDSVNHLQRRCFQFSGIALPASLKTYLPVIAVHNVVQALSWRIIENKRKPHISLNCWLTIHRIFHTNRNVCLFYFLYTSFLNPFKVSGKQCFRLPFYMLSFTDSRDFFSYHDKATMPAKKYRKVTTKSRTRCFSV